MGIKDETTAPYVQAIRNNKVLTTCFVVSMVLNVCLVIGYMYLLPLKEVVPQIIEFSSGTNNFVTVQKAGGRLTNKQALIGMFTRRYIIDREKVDHMTEEIRYPRVVATSSDEERKRFKKKYGDKEKGLYFNEDVERKIEIVRDSSLTDGLHQIEFKTIDTYKYQGDEVQYWIATMRYTFVERKVSYDEHLLNPIGFLVLKYSIIKRRES